MVATRRRGFWYAHEIRVPTLWQAAHRAGLTTASIGWPVSVGATDVDFLIPEYWRIFRPTADLKPADRDLVADLSRPEGMLRAMESSVGPYLMGNDTSTAADEIKTRFVIDILNAHKPRFMTIHLSSLDEAQREHGPFSAEANEAMEAVDRMLSRLVAASRAFDPAVIAVMVSDHGCEEIRHQWHLYVLFIQVGLIQVKIDAGKGAGGVQGWTAMPGSRAEWRPWPRAHRHAVGVVRQRAGNRASPGVGGDRHATNRAHRGGSHCRTHAERRGQAVGRAAIGRGLGYHSTLLRRSQA